MPTPTRSASFEVALLQKALGKTISEGSPALTMATEFTGFSRFKLEKRNFKKRQRGDAISAFHGNNRRVP